MNLKNESRRCGCYIKNYCEFKVKIVIYFGHLHLVHVILAENQKCISSKCQKVSFECETECVKSHTSANHFHGLVCNCNKLWTIKWHWVDIFTSTEDSFCANEKRAQNE